MITSKTHKFLSAISFSSLLSSSLMATTEISFGLTDTQSTRSSSTQLSASFMKNQITVQSLPGSHTIDIDYAKATGKIKSELIDTSFLSDFSTNLTNTSIYAKESIVVDSERDIDIQYKVGSGLSYKSRDIMYRIGAQYSYKQFTNSENQRRVYSKISADYHTQLASKLALKTGLDISHCGQQTLSAISAKVLMPIDAKSHVGVKYSGTVDSSPDNSSLPNYYSKTMLFLNISY